VKCCFYSSSNKSKQHVLVVARRVALNEGFERLSVGSLELCLDLDHVDLTTRHNDANQRVVLRSGALHGVIESLSKVVELVFNPCAVVGLLRNDSARISA
jgi:hypothetical protein